MGPVLARECIFFNEEAIRMGEQRLKFSRLEFGEAGAFRAKRMG